MCSLIPASNFVGFYVSGLIFPFQPVPCRSPSVGCDCVWRALGGRCSLCFGVASVYQLAWLFHSGLNCRVICWKGCACGEHCAAIKYRHAYDRRSDVPQNTSSVDMLLSSLQTVIHSLQSHYLPSPFPTLIALFATLLMIFHFLSILFSFSLPLFVFLGVYMSTSQRASRLTPLKTLRKYPFELSVKEAKLASTPLTFYGPTTVTLVTVESFSYSLHLFLL